MQDKDGNCVEFESEAYGSKVTSNITLPDMVLLVDGVGANIDTTGDGHIGGDKSPCEKGCIAQIKTTRKSKHFTVIGLINLLGEPILFLCNHWRQIAFFYIWAGIDLSKDKFGDESGGEE